VRVLRIAALAGAVCLAPRGVSRIAAADWPVFRGDAAHTGVAVPPEKLAAVPRQVWVFETGEDPVESSAAIVEKTAYIGTALGEILAIDIDTGKPGWRFQPAQPPGVESRPPGIRSSPAVGGGRVFYGDVAGVFRALSTADGKEVWQFKTEGEIVSSANLAEDRVLFGSYDSNLYCLGQKDGELLWKVQTEGQIFGGPAIAAGSALIAGCDGQLRAIGLANGKETASGDMGGYAAASAAVEGEMAFIPTYANQVIAVEWKKGNLAWKYEHPDRQFPFHASPALAGDRVIAAGRDKHVYALEKKTGKFLWEFPTKARIDSSPAICGPIVFIGSSDGELYALALKDGQKKWSFTAGAPITASPSIAAGRLVIGSGDGRVYCFDLREGPPGKSP